MSKYEKMVACNRQSSLEKIDLAKKAIFEMPDDGDKITIPKLMAKTGLSRGFFYKNPIVRNVLDMAMDNEIAALHEKIRSLQAENERLKKALSKKNASLIRSL